MGRYKKVPDIIHLTLRQKRKKFIPSLASFFYYLMIELDFLPHRTQDG
jgi:hypothetical protein